MAFSLWFWAHPRVRCARCGLSATREKSRRYRVDADLWSRKCKGLTETPRPATPFACPDLRAALQAAKKDEAPS